MPFFDSFYQESHNLTWFIDLPYYLQKYVFFNEKITPISINYRLHIPPVFFISSNQSCNLNLAIEFDILKLRDDGREDIASEHGKIYIQYVFFLNKSQPWTTNSKG